MAAALVLRCCRPLPSGGAVIRDGCVFRTVRRSRASCSCRGPVFAWRDVPAESGAAPGDSLAPAARPDRGRRMVRLHAAPLGELGPHLLQPRNPPMEPRRHRRNDAQLQSPRRLSAQRRDPFDVPPLTTAAGPGPQRAGPWPSGPAVRSCRGWAWGSNPRAFHRRRRRARAIRLRHQPLGQHRQRRELPLKTQGRLGRAGVLLKPLQRVQGLPRHGDVKEGQTLAVPASVLVRPI